MDELQACLIEECGLEGARGLHVARLFDLVSSRIGARIDADFEALLWRRIRTTEELEFYSRCGAEGGGRGSPGILMDRVQLDTAEWRNIQDRDQLRVVATESVRHAVLGIHGNMTNKIHEKTLQMLEEIGRSREKGLQQRELAGILGIDNQSVFYFLKPLKSAGVVSVRGVSITGELTKTRTNQIKLARYSPANAEQDDDCNADENIVLRAKKALGVLKNTPNGVLSETVLKKLTTGSRKGDRKHHLWEKIRKRMITEKKVERILVAAEASSKRKPIPCLRLLVPADEIETEKEMESNHVVQLQLAEQFYRHVERSGTKGCTQPELRVLMGVDGKFSTMMCQDLKENFGVKVVADMQGKSFSYRYFTADNYGKKEQAMEKLKSETAAPIAAVIMEEDSAIKAAIQAPEGTGIKEDNYMAGSADDACDFLTAEMVKNHPYWTTEKNKVKNADKEASSRRGVVTAKFLRLANNLLQKLREEKVVQVANVRNLLREQEDLEAHKDSVASTTLDFKTVTRLINDLVGMGVIQRRSFNLAKQNTNSASDTKKLTEFVFDKSVDLQDKNVVADLIESAMQEKKVVMFGKGFKFLHMEISQPAVNPDSLQDVMDLDGEEVDEYYLCDKYRFPNSANSSLAMFNLTLNGLNPTPMSRACALHRFLIDEYMDVGDGAPGGATGGFFRNELMYNLTLIDFLQIVGCTDTIPDIQNMLGRYGKKRMRELDDDVRVRFIRKDLTIDRRLDKSIHILYLLGLVAVDFVSNDEAAGALDGMENSDSTARFYRVQRCVYPVSPTDAAKGAHQNAEGSRTCYTLHAGHQDDKGFKGFWCEQFERFAPVLRKGAGQEDEYDNEAVEKLCATSPFSDLAKKRFWFSYSDLPLPSRKVQVLDAELESMHIDKDSHISAANLGELRQAEGLSKEKLARHYSRVPKFVPPYHSEMMSTLKASVVQRTIGSGMKRKLGLDAERFPRTQKLQKRRIRKRTDPVVEEEEPPQPLEEEEDLDMEDMHQASQLNQPKHSKRGPIRRFVWSPNDDIKLLALCCDKRANAKFEVGRVLIDWHWVAKIFGCKRSALVRRFLFLRKDLARLKVLQRMVMTDGVKYRPPVEEDIQSAEDADGVKDVIAAAEPQLSQSVIDMLQRMRFVVKDEDETLVPPRERVPLPSKVEDVAEHYEVLRLYADAAENSRTFKHPFPNCSPVESRLVESLLMILTVPHHKYKVQEAYQLISHFPKEVVEECLKKLQELGLLVQNKASPSQRLITLSHAGLDAFKPSKHLGNVMQEIRQFISGPALQTKEDGMPAEWELGFTAGDGEAAACISLMLQGKIRASVKIPPPGEADEDDDALAKEQSKRKGGVSAHLQLMTQLFEGSGRDETNMEERRALPEWQTTFSVSDEHMNELRNGLVDKDQEPQDSAWVAPKESGAPSDFVVKLLERWGFGKDGGGWGVAGRQRGQAMERVYALVAAGGQDGVGIDKVREVVGNVQDEEDGSIDEAEAMLICLMNRGRVRRVRAYDHHRYVAQEHAAVWMMDGAPDRDKAKAEEGEAGKGPDSPQVAGLWVGFSGEGNDDFMQNLRTSIMETVCKNPGISTDALQARFPLVNQRTMMDMLEVMAQEKFLNVRSLQIPKCSFSSPSLPVYIPRVSRTWNLARSSSDNTVARYVMPCSASSFKMALDGKTDCSIPSPTLLQSLR